MQCWERRKFLTCKVIFPNPPRNPLGTIDNVDLHEETQPSCRPVGPPHYRSSATSRPVVEWTNSANTSRERHVGLRRLRDHSMNIEVVTQFERSPILYSTSHQWKYSDAPPLMTWDPRSIAWGTPHIAVKVYQRLAIDPKQSSLGSVIVVNRLPVLKPLYTPTFLVNWPTNPGSVLQGDTRR